MRKLVVQNTSLQNKAVVIFDLTIYPGLTANLIDLADVTENSVVDSLESGELRTKLLNGDLTVLECNLLIPSGDADFTEFLNSVGLGNNIKPNDVSEYLTRNNWYIDPVTGDDNAPGDTPGSALKTYAEFQRRVGDFTILTPTETFLNINILNDLGFTDPITFRNIMGRGRSCFINGSEKVLATGTLTGTTDKDRSTNTPWQITDTAVDWSQYIGYKVVITSGQGTDSGAYILADLGSNTAHMTEWVAEISTFDGGTFQGEPPATGSEYKIIDYTAVTIGSTQVGYEEQTGVYDPDLDYWAPVGGLVIQRVHTQFDFDNGTLTTSFPSRLFSTETSTAFCHSIVDNYMLVPTGSTNTSAGNVLFRRGVSVVNGAALIQTGGGYLPIDEGSNLFVDRGSSAYLGGDITFYNPNGEFNAELIIRGLVESSSLSFWNTGHCLNIQAGGHFWGIDYDSFGDGQLVDNHLWGTSDFANIVIFEGAKAVFTQFKYNDGYTPTYPTLTFEDGYLGWVGNPYASPFGNDIEIGDINQAFGFNPATGQFVGPTYLTWDNMDTAVGSGGFLVKNTTVDYPTLLYPEDVGRAVTRHSIAQDPTGGAAILFIFNCFVNE